MRNVLPSSLSFWFDSRHPFQIELLGRSPLRNKSTDENRCVTEDDHGSTVLRHPPCLRASVLLSHPNRFESERLSGQ